LKKFFVIFASQAFSLLGSSIVGFALAWYLAKETGSATILSNAMLVNILPQVFLGPFIGPFIDRWDRKKILIFSDFTTMLLTVLLVVLFYTGTVQVWHIYIVMFCRSFSGSFQGPAFRASIPMIVPEKHLTRANGLNSTLFGVMNLIGPPSGAFLMEALSMQWVLSVDIVTAIIAIGILLPFIIPQPLRTTITQKLNVIGDMVQGFRYILSWKSLVFLLLLGAMWNFFEAPLNSLLPLFVTKYLGGDVLKLGWLGTAFGTGLLAGGVILSVWGGFKKRVFTIFIGFILSSVAITVFSLTAERVFFMGLTMWMTAGFGNAFTGAPMEAILQSTVPRDMQGRVFTVLSSICTAAIPIGLAIVGPIADVTGVRAIYLFSGPAMLIIIIAGFFFGNLMNMENKK
jgi:MFS transporter, DHA3 family, macrolide efflux protein